MKMNRQKYLYPTDNGQLTTDSANRGNGHFMKLFAGSLILLLIMVLTACTASGPVDQKLETGLRQQIGNAYGVRYFSQLEQLQYTFNVRVGEKQISRFWIWEPKINRVTFKGMDYRQSVSYYRYEIENTASSALKTVDAWFINDNYWLLFPFHIAWDTDAKLEDAGRRPLPIGNGRSGCAVVTYPPTEAFIPGDVYEVYYDENYRLRQWTYRRSGSDKPASITTWENHRQMGPLVVALDHRGENENFRVWFTGVGIKLSGVDSWIFAE